ncbi:MAG TPA: glutathione S-transferase family protein, partial [Pseudomonadales bacterium]
MITLYGTSKSRASRCLVALEELGLTYRHVPIYQHGATAADRDAIRALNPNARIPVLEDDGLILWESMAINLYLADKHGGALWPSASRERALTYQWTLWSQTEMDRPDWHEALRSGDRGRIALAREQRLATLSRLDTSVTGRDYLLGDAFTFADLNVAATISQPNEGGR